MNKLYLYVFGLWLLLIIPKLSAQVSLPANDTPLQADSNSVLILNKLTDKNVNLTAFCSIYMVDKNEDLQLNSVRTLWQENKFTNLNDFNYPPKFESGEYHYWLEFQVANNSEDTLDLIFRLPRLDSNFYYQFIDNQLDRVALFGNKLAWKEQKKLNLDVPDGSALPIQLLPITKYHIFVRTADNLYLTAKINPLLSSTYLNLKELTLKQLPVILIDGALLGILFFLTISSLLQYSQDKDKAFLFYGIYVGFTFLQYWVLFDYWNFAFKVIQPLMADRNYIKVPIEVGMIMSYLLFIQFFLNEKNEFPLFSKCIWLTLKVTGVYLIFSILISLVEVRWSWIYHYYFLAGMILMSFILLFQIWRMKTPLSFYIFWGMMMLLFFAIIFPSMFRLDYLNESSGQIKDYDYLSRQLGVFLELLFFSLGLGYKRLLADQEKEQLTQLELFKNQFYTNLTHEFRTPLTVMLGMTNELENELKEGHLNKTKHSVEMIRRNSHKLLELVNQMLTLAKAESGNLKLNLQNGDVIPLANYLSESFHSLAKNQQINLVVYAETESLIMDYDEEKFTIIFSNLLSNAIKFTGPNGKIIIHLNHIKKSKKNNFLIKIKDTGIGISAQDLPNIFNRFYQTPNSINQQKGGTGIGLALTKELTELMGGTITVNSQKGKGSEFIVLLPIHQNAPIKSELPKKETFSTTTTKDLAPSNSFGNINLPLALIIEDNVDVAHYISRCLERTYQIIHAKNGLIGIEMAIEKTPDVIICDVMMPEKDGFEVCGTLKKDERTDHIPIIILTAKVTLENRIKGLSLGADAYLSKPFEKEELLIRLEKLMEIRQRLQQKYSSALITHQIKAAAYEPKIDAFIEKIEKIVLEHLHAEDFSVNDLARLLFLSRSQVHRKIKALTGMSSTIYIRFIRLEKAKKLLDNKELTISEIAHQVGFKSPVYFSKVFKEMYGKSPNATRN